MTSPPAPSRKPPPNRLTCRAARYAWALRLARIYEVFPLARPRVVPRCASSPY